MHPNARTLRGIGMTSFEVRDYVTAWRVLQESLADSRSPLSDEQRAQVEALLRRTRNFVAVYTVVIPEDTTLSIDGIAASLEADGSLVVGVGTHDLRMRNRAGREAHARIDVGGGESGALPLDLSPLDPPVIEAVPAPLPVAVAPIVPPRRESELRPLAWGLVIGGAIVAAFGGVTLGVGIADLRTVETSRYGTIWSTIQGPYERAPILTTIGTVALVAGIASLGAGLIWVLVDEASGSRVAVLPDRLVLEGSF